MLMRLCDFGKGFHGATKRAVSQQICHTLQFRCCSVSDFPFHHLQLKTHKRPRSAADSSSP